MRFCEIFMSKFEVAFCQAAFRCARSPFGALKMFQNDL